MSRPRVVRALLVATLLGAATGATAAGQDTASVRAARRLYDELRYEGAIAAARRALDAGRLARSDLLDVYEVLAFSHAALDSSSRAVEAFRELLLLDPDREPDVMRVSPRITSLYASALGQVLVVRRLGLDSVTFVSGEGRGSVRLQVSRPATVTARVVGQGLDSRIDSQALAGQALLAWTAVDAAGRLLAPGRYDVIVEAVAGRERFSSRLPVRVRHAPVDTLAHLTSLPGYEVQPEQTRPRRDWSPLGVAGLFTALGGGLTLALQNRSLGSDGPRELTVAAAGVMAFGAALSARRPPPQPVPAAILFNRLLREQLARRNAEIARDNAQRRQRTLVTLTAASP